MGLPIWRDPDEISIKKEGESSVKPDPTAAARSPIRRRSPPYAPRRSGNYPSRRRLPPRFEREPLPSVGFNGVSEARRGEQRGVPPVSTLLESADTRSPRPGVHFRRRRADEATSVAQDQGSLVDTGRREDARARVVEEARRIQAEVVPGDWEDWSEEDREAWLEENNIPRYLYHRDPEVMDGRAGIMSQHRPRSRDEPRRNTLPTPPHDESGDGDSLFIPADQSTTLHRTHSVRRRHPLSRSWRPESPVNGLGDRNRSPTPADNWDIMHQTITPDATLPSADSSFTSAAASLSFTSNNSASTSLTDASTNSRRNSQEDNESVSSVDPDNLVCDDDEIAATTAFAEHVYRHEQSTYEGRDRISRHRAELDVDEHRFAHQIDQPQVEIGFRLIDEALNTPEGRIRVFSLSESLPAEVRDNLSSWINGNREAQNTAEQNRTRLAHIPDDEPPQLRRSETQSAVRNQVHDFFRRFTADETLSANQREIERTSPPPYHSIPVTISQDGPEAHPVSPPSARSERDMADLLLSGDEQDLSAVRRIVERLAQRDDVPQEWWMSMGLNLSRTHARERSRSRDSTPATSGRVRTGRVGRDRSSASHL